MTDTTERDEAAILAELESARQAYQDLVDTAPRAQVAAASDRIRALQRELSVLLSRGAAPCPVCSEAHAAALKEHEARLAAGVPSEPPAEPPAVMGMLKRPAHEHRGEPRPALYEVGCVVHDACARGASAEAAVRRWNLGVWIEPSPALGSVAAEGAQAAGT